MAIHLHQVAAQPILHYHFEGSVTLHDLIALHNHEQSLFCTLRADDHVQAIVDMHAIDTIPASLFPKLQQLHLAHDPRIRLIVVAGANPYLRALTKSLNLGPRRSTLLFCGTMDEAFAAVAANTPPETARSTANPQET